MLYSSMMNRMYADCRISHFRPWSPFYGTLRQTSPKSDHFDRFSIYRTDKKFRLSILLVGDPQHFVQWSNCFWSNFCYFSKKIMLFKTWVHLLIPLKTSKNNMPPYCFWMFRKKTRHNKLTAGVFLDLFQFFYILLPRFQKFPRKCHVKYDWVAEICP